MKLNRIISLAVIGIALFALLLQGAGSPAAAHNTLASVSAQVAPQANTGKDKPASPADQAPYHLTAQGRLTDPSGNPITTARNLTFKLYTALSGGTLLFTEGPVSVTPDSNGLFTYQLGSATSINISLLQSMANKVYLGITVGSDAEMAPRLELTLAPYSASLAPGAVVEGSVYGDFFNGAKGALNAFNDDGSNSHNAGLYASGATAVLGTSSSTGSSDGYGGQFFNDSGGSGLQYGVYAQGRGFGLYASSNVGTGQQQSAGVVGESSDANGVGGVFTATNAVVGYASSGGNSDAYGGLFSNSGGGSGTQEGVHAEVGSTNSSVPSSAGRFINDGGGSSLQYGVSASNYSTGGTDGYGGSFDNNSGGSGSQYGIYAVTNSTGGTYGYGGNFTNGGGGSGPQYGVYANSPGYGLYASSSTNTSSEQSAGVVGESFAIGGVGGVFTDTSGIGVAGVGSASNGSGGRFSGFEGLLANGYGANMVASNDGLDVGGSGGSSYAIYSTQPSGNTNYTLNGAAHIHGSNISAANYAVEVVYHDTTPANVGDVLALDGINRVQDGVTVLGVVRATSSNAKAAVGVLDKRLDSVKVNGVDKTIIDGQATSIHAGDHAYIVIMGSARMKVSGGSSIGDDLTLDSTGQAIIASDSSKHTIGKVASQPDQDGYVTVFVNLK